MNPIIVAEHFELTPAIRAHVEEQLHKINVFFEEEDVIRVFLGVCAKKEFTVLLKAHWRRRDTVSRANGPNLYTAINHAATTLRQKLQKTKNRRITGRKDLSEALATKERDTYDNPRVTAFDDLHFESMSPENR